MNEDNEIKKTIDNIVFQLSYIERRKQKSDRAIREGRNLLFPDSYKWLYMDLVEDHAKKGRSFLGSLIRYSRNQNYYIPHVANHALAIENYVREHPKYAKDYGWNTPLVAQRYRIPGSERFLGIDEIRRKNEESNTDVQSGSAPPVKPPSTPPPPPPTSTPPPSPDDDDDGKNKAPKKWGVYKHNFTNLLEGFNPEDYKKKSSQDNKSLKVEKDNTKAVGQNTASMKQLRGYLGPFAKMILPFYSVKAIYDSLSSNTEASVQRVKRRTFGGIYGTDKDRGHFKRMAHTMGSYGASMSDIRNEYANQKKWSSVLEFGMGMDKIEAIAMILGKAPGPAEIKDEDKMQEWLSKNLYGISDHQARQLSAFGVASDTFIESARKGSATDMIGEAARIRSHYEDLNKQIGWQENPFRKLQFNIGENLAESIAHGGIRGFATEFGMDVLGKLGNVWQWIDNIGANEYDKRDQHALIPNQNNVTVNLYGNVDSEERLYSFAEQIGGVVRNAEK